MNFQVTVLKILVSYPGGFATMADLKRDMAILATSGRDWADRTKRLAARVPELDIFSQALIERLDGGWRITGKGRAVLALMEARPSEAEPFPWQVHLKSRQRAPGPAFRPPYVSVEPIDFSVAAPPGREPAPRLPDELGEASAGA